MEEGHWRSRHSVSYNYILLLTVGCVSENKELNRGDPRDFVRGRERLGWS